MDTFDRVLIIAKNNRGTGYPFCAGIDGKNIVIGGSIQAGKAPKSLKSEMPADKHIAWGHIVWSDDGEVRFQCEKLEPRFKPRDVKELSPLLKVAPTIVKGGADDDAPPRPSGPAPLPPGVAPPRPTGKAPEPPNAAANPDGKKDEKLVLLWQKSLRAALEEEDVDPTFLAQTKGLMAPYQVAFPAHMIKAFKEAGKQAFLQQVMDNLNARLKADAIKIKKVLESDAAPAKKIAAFEKVKSGLDAHIETVVDKTWIRYVSSFDVPGKTAQRFNKAKAVVIPAIGFAASVASAATAASGVAAVIAIPAVLAAMRSASAGIKGYQVYLGSLGKASERVKNSTEALQRTVGAAKDEITGSEAGKAGAKAILNALAGAGWSATIKSVKDDIRALSDRIGQSEAVRDKALAPVLKSIELLTDAEQELKDGIAAAKQNGDGGRAGVLSGMMKQIQIEGPKLSEELDAIIENHKKIAPYRTKVDGAADIVVSMQKALGPDLQNLELLEKGATAAVSAGLGAYNGVGGAISSLGEAPGVVITTLGGLVDVLGTAEDVIAVVQDG
ncbi:hypothetical protein [Neptunicoccus cionae]|uniref:Uncharacterized protein n=1 Tax=Neptunicoccus cionae TaxID=2035344 RepID=A0A916VLU5_9RHOB|nr:hypothetical protein [Amylibacter cionae]GGA06801.1 hypothetical protein GCM10011498_03220 [Amylibacter cionae]